MNLLSGSRRAAISLGTSALLAFLTACGGGSGGESTGAAPEKAASSLPAPLPSRKALSANSSGQIILDGMIQYIKTPGDVSELNSRGFYNRILVWPSEEYKGNWEHLDKKNGPSSRLGLSDVPNIQIAANGICDYARSHGIEYIAIDLEWPLESEDNRFSLALVTSTIKNQFLQGQCVGIKLGAYGIPYTAELDVDLKGKFQGHIDFAAPVLYFTHTAATEEEDLTYWQNDSNAKRLTASTWSLPIIPFVAVRRFDSPNLQKPLSLYLVRESFKFVADRAKFDGIIIWDCGCFGIDGTYHPASDPENTSSWSNIQDRAYTALDQLGLTGPNQLTLAYPGAIAFGNVPTGQLANSSVATLTNTSSVPVTGITIAASGSAFSIDNNCGSTLNANASCTFVVKFSPVAGQNQSYNGTLQISRDGVSVITKPLSGTGVVPAPALTFSYPGEINFGNAPAGQIYNSSVATLSNTSNVTASNLNVTASGVFSIGNSNCGTNLAANTSCTFVIRFSPTAGQNLSYNGTLQINADGANTITRALSGVGVVPAPALAFSYTGSINFGSAPAGQTYNSSVATLSNTSSVAATNLSMAASGVFSIGSNTCAGSLAANTSCTFVIRFSPTAAQNQGYNGTLQISADGASTITRPLSGTGMAPAFALSYTGAINFGNAPAGQSWNSDVTTLTNNGSVAATGLNVTASGVFSIANSNCGTSLAANASCTFVIRFTPTAGQNQSYTGTLQVSSDNAAPLTRPLSGTGTTP